MTADKARDLFSDFMEGSLEPALRQQFEHALQSQPGLADEYRQFEAVVRQLESAQSEEVPIPYGLHERIISRLDRNRAEAHSRSSLFDLFARWRMPIIGAVAVTAVVASVIAILPREGARNQDSPVQAGFFKIPDDGAGLSLATNKGVVAILHGRASGVTIEVVREADSQVVERFDVTEQGVARPLTNKAEEGQAFTVRAGGRSLTVAIPGTAPRTELTGAGTVLDYANRVADAYGVPVVVEVADPDRKAEWSIDAKDVLASKVEPKLDVEAREDGSLFLTD